MATVSAVGLGVCAAYYWQFLPLIMRQLSRLLEGSDRGGTPLGVRYVYALTPAAARGALTLWDRGPAAARCRDPARCASGPGGAGPVRGAARSLSSMKTWLGRERA